MIKISVDKTALTPLTRETLTSGMVQAVGVQFTFSPEWAGLSRVAVFTAGETATNCVLDEEDSCYIPWECLAHPGDRLLVGVYGTLDGTVVLPSEQCDLGLILAGAALGEDGSTEGSPSLAEQVIIRANEAMAVAQSVREDADAGAFRGETGAAATIAIGTVTSAGIGEPAAISNSGTPGAAVLDFVLPAGPQGEKGDPGEQGPQGMQGEKGDPGDPGDPGLRLTTLSLPLGGWVGEAAPYTQALAIPGGTAATMVDLQPDAAVLAALLADGVGALYVQNDAGSFTAYALGAKPTADLTMQACLSEPALPIE